MKTLTQNDKDYIFSTLREVKDFPKPGILFYDITTLLNDKKAFNFLLDHLASRYQEKNLDFIVGIESRGFIFGAALASKLGIGFVPIRKPKKLPFITISQKYSLEYGVDQVEMHIDAFRDIKDPKVVLVDDLIATGGTAKAAVDLIEQTGAKCLEACFLLNIKALGGETKILNSTEVYSVLEV